MYITVCKTDDQYKFDAWNRTLRAHALRQPRGMGWSGRGFHDGGTRAPVADTCQCMTKSTIVLYNNYPPIKINFKKPCFWVGVVPFTSSVCCDFLRIVQASWEVSWESDYVVWWNDGKDRRALARSLVLFDGECMWDSVILAAYPTPPAPRLPLKNIINF